MPQLDTLQTVKRGFVPALSYSSDLGLLAGGVVNRNDYGGEIYPYRSFAQIVGAASTKGLFTLGLSIDQTRTFGTDIRSRFNFGASRVLDGNFFGIGNDSEFIQSRWDNDEYLAEFLNVEFEYLGRLPLYDPRLQRNGGLEILLLAGFEYELPKSRGDNTFFAQNRPLGDRGQWVNYIGTGLHWEKRNSEFRPTKGFYSDWQLQLAPKLLLSDHNSLTSVLELRNYLPFRVGHDFVLATRFSWTQIFGTVPYWSLARLGNDSTLRGFPFGRFRGDASLLYNVEVRTWLVEFERANIRLGAQAFTDFGRVFSKGDADKGIFRDYKQTGGIGAVISFFHEDFFLRMDQGFSNEIGRFYMGIGYMF